MNPFLNTAFKAARKAGQMMIRASGNLDAVKVDSKAFNDFVSDVDRNSEMILVEALKEAYPHHKITCFPVVDQSMMDKYLAILKDFLAKTAGGRREGAASLDLCAVAAGRLDGFFEFNLKPWDIAAGALIVQEAGGIVTDMSGNEGWLESGDIVAANPKVLAQMLQIIGGHL